MSRNIAIKLVMLTAVLAFVFTFIAKACFPRNKRTVVIITHAAVALLLVLAESLEAN